MWGISYDTWKECCQMYFDLGIKRKAYYLQWYPFTKISQEEQYVISSEEFYDKYIKNGGFIFYPTAMFRSENYIQKSDGSFRDSSLVSPILYLLLQSVGKEIARTYKSQRNKRVEVYYSGNYEEMRPYYKQDYDDFFKSVNAGVENAQFFIKTDISSFFSNINVDILINRIDSVCNKPTVCFSQTALTLLKELLLYCGAGKFPLVENSVASSFLATIVYLDEIDCKLTSFIDKHIQVFQDYKIIRYVDDMYILISTNSPEADIHEAYNKIRNEYSSILKEYGLALNTKKCCLKPANEINDELKKSLYDDSFYEDKNKLGSIFSGALISFFEDLSQKIEADRLDIEVYNDLIEKHFSDDSIEYTATEVFNYFVYEDPIEVKSEKLIDLINKLIKRDFMFISFDPKRLSMLIMKTENSRAIRSLLNELFNRNRSGLWNSYDTIIAISYLIQSGFKHIDLIKAVDSNSESLNTYYHCFCKNSFVKQLIDERIDSYLSIIGEDWKACYLYFMYLTEQKKHNNLAEFAYFKSFFDRFTADMAFAIDYNPKDKNPNYCRFYKKDDLKKFYSLLQNASEIINSANKLRNSNPLAHASAGMLDCDSTSEEIDKRIKELKHLVDSFIDVKGL